MDAKKDKLASQIPVVHYGPPGLKELDPRKQGSGVDAYKFARTGKPQTAFQSSYAMDARPEQLVTQGVNQHRYISHINPDEHYDFSKDEKDLLSKAQKDLAEGKAEGNPANSIDLARTMAKKMGYKGTQWEMSGAGRIFEHFDKVPLKPDLRTAEGGHTPEKIREMADEYAQSKGKTLVHGKPMTKVNPKFGANIAKAYEEMQHNPQDPKVKEAYRNLINEVLDQFSHIMKNGLKVTPVTSGANPYKTSKDLFKDIHENGHMYYFPTEQGFGSGEENNTEHPLMASTQFKQNEKPLLANDIFRIVHDYYGHAKEKYSFGPSGEESAWKEHMQMLSPPAQKALTSETRGQNSWVNFGPHGEANRADPANTKYADQKAGLLPDWASIKYGSHDKTQKEAEGGFIRKCSKRGRVQRLADGGNVMPAGFELEQSTAVPPVAAYANGLPTGFDLEPSPDEKYGAPTEVAKTALEGIGQGIAGPLAPMAEKAIGVQPEDILGREKANPWTHGLGEMTGLVGGALTGTGEAAVLEHAGELGKTIAGLGGLAEDASTASKLAAGTIKGAVEQGLFQGGDEASKMLLNDPDTSAQSALANMGWAAAVGGGAGLALGAISPLWKAAVGDKAAPIIEDMKARYKFRTENPDLTASATEELRNKVAAADDLRSKLYTGEDGSGGLKSEMIRQNLSQDMEPIIKQSQDLNTKFATALTKMEEDSVSYPPHLTKSLVNDVNKWQQASFGEGATSETAFNATQELKKTIADFSRFDKSLTRRDPAYSFVQDIKGLGHELRTSLENPKVWGEAANIQKDINSAVSSFIDKDLQKGFTSKFMTNSPEGKVVNPMAMDTYMKQLGKPQAEIKQDFMREYLDRHDELVNTVNKVFTDRGLEPQIAHTPTNVLRSTLGETTTGSKIMDTLIDKALAKVGGPAIGATIGGTIGYHVGVPGIGALLGEHLLGPAAGSVLNGVMKPLIEQKTSSSGLKSAIDYGINAVKGQNMLGKAAANVFVSGKDVLSSKMIPDQADRDKVDKLVTSLQKQPNKMQQLNNGNLSHYAQNHAVALAQASTQVAGYLESTKPQPHVLGPLDKPVPPQPSEIARYNRALDIAQQPAIVMQHIKDGTLQTSDIKDLNAMYPALYKSMVQKLSNAMISRHSDEETIPYKTRIGLSLFIGQPVDGSMAPNSILAAQPMPQQPQAPQQGAKGGKKGSMKDVGKSNKSYMTPNQSAEADRTSRD